MRKQIIVSAPAKIHLLGEHSVVYARPALLTAINKRVYVRIKEGKEKNPKSNNVRIRKVVESVVEGFFRQKIPPHTLSIEATFPVGCGLGASAAICAAYIGALLLLLGKKFDKEKINQLSYDCEKVFHGNPSGADNATVVFGGLVWYRKELESIKLLKKLDDSSISRLTQFVLINSSKPEETTKEMVEKVAGLAKKYPSRVKNIFYEQEILVKQLAQAILLKNYNSLMFAIRQGERNLEELGVVGKKAKGIIREVERAGGVAKICGGGGVKNGSGMILCFHQDANAILEIATRQQLEAFPILFEKEGVRIE